MQNLRETRAGHELNVSYEESLPFFSSDEATELGRALVASGLGVKDKRNNLRKQRSYGDRGVRKWVTDWRGPKALPVARRVRALGERIAAHLGCDPFEYCALQSYKPEDDYRMGMRAHTDSEQDPLSPIVGITIFPRDPSATRPLNMVSGERLTKDRVTRGPVDLAHGSLYAIWPPTNAWWMHALPDHVEPRISLTFRRVPRDANGGPVPDLRLGHRPRSSGTKRASENPVRDNDDSRAKQSKKLMDAYFLKSPPKAAAPGPPLPGLRPSPPPPSPSPPPVEDPAPAKRDSAIIDLTGEDTIDLTNSPDD